MKFAAWYGIGVGCLVIVQWLFFILSGSVPELRSEPVRIAFHLAAEFLMAAALIASGAGALRGHKWARPLLLAALGMAIYSEIVSPGYFAQQGQWPLVGMFALLLAGALVSVAAVAREETRPDGVVGARQIRGWLA